MQWCFFFSSLSVLARKLLRMNTSFTMPSQSEIFILDDEASKI